jgi:O-antigen ligase
MGVYSLWFVYGSLADNSWALQEFREMVFTALSLPPILYFASLLSARSVFEKFVLPGSLLLLVLAAFGTPNAALIVSTFFVSYFTLTLLYRNAWAIAGLGLVSLPYLLKFSKPMIVLFAFCVAVSFLLAGYLNPKSVNLILSRFKIKIVLIALSILLALVAVAALINAWSGGAIEEIIRWYFLKERLTASGQTVYADVSGGRFAIWLAALESWMQRPFVGFGLGSEVEAYSTGWITKVQFHSYVIQALHHTGLIGLLLITGGWTTWLFRTTRKVFAIRNVNEKIVLGAMLVYVFGIFFYGLYGHSLSYPPSAQFFWLCVGFLCVLRPPVHYRVQS